jgi:adenylate kinase family enzyme
MKITKETTKQLFSQAYILGGSPCSGKSTIAERLSCEFDLQYYKVDDHERDHAKRSNPSRHPTMYKYSTMNWNEIWMRPVTDQVQEEFEYYRERFEMIAQDLEKYEQEKTIILEGAAYLPELLELNEANPNHVIFLVPTKEFQLHYYSQRPWIKDVLKECEDPEHAFANWMMRDHLFGQEILRQAKSRNYKTIVVDGRRNIDQQYQQVKEYFSLK